MCVCVCVDDVGGWFLYNAHIIRVFCSSGTSNTYITLATGSQMCTQLSRPLIIIPWSSFLPYVTLLGIGCLSDFFPCRVRASFILLVTISAVHHIILCSPCHIPYTPHSYNNSFLSIIISQKLHIFVTHMKPFAVSSHIAHLYYKLYGDLNNVISKTRE